MKLRNVNPIGTVDVPILRRQGHPDDKVYLDDGNPVTLPADHEDRHGHGCLEPGEVFDTDVETGSALLEQRGNYEAADDEAKAIEDAIILRLTAAAEGAPVQYEDWTVPNLRAELKRREAPSGGTKADLCDRLTQLDAQEG